jgi:hypothetical protein
MPREPKREILPIPDIPAPGPTTFTGEVEWVEIELGLDDHNHLIKPEDRISLAMGIQ